MKKAVIISCFNWYIKRIKPIREILISAGYEVDVLLGDFDHVKKQTIDTKYSECTYIRIMKYNSNLSIKRMMSHIKYSKNIKKALKNLKPDMIYALIPPNRVSKECSRYKKNNPNTKFYIDIIDLWPESIPLGKLKKTLPAIVWMKWRNDAIKIADYVFTECELYQEQLKGILTASKTTTLYLYKEQTDDERQLIKDIIEKKKTDAVIRFAYIGSMNNIIDVDGICRVIQSFIRTGNTCELHAIGNGEQKQKFEEAVKNTGCKTLFYGPIFNEIEKIKILAPCDFAFNMMKENISVGLTIKSIDYLSYGLPLINNIKGDTWKLVEDQGIGINVSNDTIKPEPIDHNIILDVFREYFSKGKFIQSVSGVIYEQTKSFNSNGCL